MFILTDAPRKVWWPVTWATAVDGGKTVDAKIEMQFVLLSPDDAADIVAKARELDNDDDQGRLMSERQAELLSSLVADWKGVGADATSPIAFSLTELARFFRIPGAFFGALNAYSRCMAGQPEIRRKN